MNDPEPLYLLAGFPDQGSAARYASAQAWASRPMTTVARLTSYADIQPSFLVGVPEMIELLAISDRLEVIHDAAESLRESVSRDF